jgi:D-amino-acid dehydrogenase
VRSREKLPLPPQAGEGSGKGVRATHVAIIGSGIVGTCTALELLRDGHRVTIVDPDPPGGEHAASYGNAGWLSPCSVAPLAAPGMWRQVPRYLADPLGPLAIRWRYLPRLTPWLIRFLRAGSVRRLDDIARAMRALVADAPERHQQLAAEAGAAGLIRRDGLLYVFPSRDAFAAEARAWQLRRDNGVTWLELDADALHAREPDLHRRYGFGVLVEAGGHCVDPGAYLAALVRRAEALGAIRHQGQASGFVLRGRRLRAVRTATTDLACERAVIAAGARSGRLAQAVGDRVPLETERGYHAIIAGPGLGPRHPVMPSDARVAITPMQGGLRVAGQVELAGLDAAPDWRRARAVRDLALAAFPGLSDTLQPARIRFWMGHRPALPDSLPCIGFASASADIVHAYGHGHIGLASAPATGRLAADLIGAREAHIDPAPYSPQRFR